MTTFDEWWSALSGSGTTLKPEDEDVARVAFDAGLTAALAKFGAMREERDDYRQAWRRDVAKGREFEAENAALRARLGNKAFNASDSDKDDSDWYVNELRTFLASSPTAGAPPDEPPVACGTCGGDGRVPSSRRVEVGWQQCPACSPPVPGAPPAHGECALAREASPVAGRRRELVEPCTWCPAGPGEDCFTPSTTATKPHIHVAPALPHSGFRCAPGCTPEQRASHVAGRRDFPCSAGCGRLTDRPPQGFNRAYCSAACAEAPGTWKAP